MSEIGAERFEIFNKTKTIGVATVPGGAVNGVFLDAKVRNLSERELAREILAVAAVASMRGRLALRDILEQAAATAEESLPPELFEVLPTVPNADQFEEFRRDTLNY
ncbi:MAG: hypothetical protein WAV90_11555 [Gordonia amarae]